MAPTVKETEQQNTVPAASAALPKVQPVALEISVAVNGVRTIEGSEKREPFSETTQTVLVFGTGAVIRLNSTVATGQLLFLTNEKTKKEVVCQVVKSKNYRSASGYVELEFTEPAIGFWGMRFPTDRVAPAAVSSGAPAPAVRAKPANVAVAEKKNVSPSASPVLPVKPAAALPPAAPVSLSAPPANVTPIVTVNAEATTNLEPAAPVAPPVVDSATEELKRQTARLQEQLSTLLFEDPQASVPAPPSPSAVLQLDAIAMSDATAHIFEMAGPESGGGSAKAEPSAAVSPKTPQTLASTPKAKAEKQASGLHEEEVKIPAWLEPLARNAATSSLPAPSTAGPSVTEPSSFLPPPSAVPPLASKAAEPVSQPASNLVSFPLTIAPVGEPESGEAQVTGESYDFGSKVEPEPIAAESGPRGPRFEGGLFGSNEEAAADQESGGGKKGVWIGAIAATVLLAAGGGWWYIQQNGHAAASGTGAVSHQVSEQPATQPQEQQSFQTAPSLPQSSNSQTFSNPSPVAAEQASKANHSTQSLAPVTEVQKIGNAREGSKSNSTSAVVRATEPVVQPEETKKSSFKNLHLAAPTAKSGKTASLSNEAEPGIVMDSTTAGTTNLGLTANSGPKAPKAPVPVGGEVSSAQLVSSVPPVYPQLARAQRLSGDVKVDALIDENGHVTAMKVISGPVMLHQAAMDALKQWRYKPAMLNGSAVSMHLMVTIQFRLK